MTTVITSPAPQPIWLHQPSLFLGGSIELGAAENWQRRCIDLCQDQPITLFNPRRPDWNADATEFEVGEQVLWELNALSLVDAILIYFSPGTLSPISLLELGLYAQSGKLIACCPTGFWRRTNVVITCSQFQVPLFSELPTAMAAAVTKAHARFEA